MNDADDPKPPVPGEAPPASPTRIHRSQIAAILREVADLLELRGENPFRSRALRQRRARHRRAGGGPAGSLRGRHARRSARHRSGSGRRHRGDRPHRDRSRCSPSCGPSFPPECRISCASRVSDRSGCASSSQELRIDSPAALERACREGRVAALPGFGAKSQEKLLQGLGSLQRYGERHLLPVARAAAEALAQHLRAHPAVGEVEIAGSLRRCCETIGDLDLLVTVAAAEREAVVDHFLAAPSVLQPIEHGTTKAAAVVAGGLRADLRLVEADEMASALLHFTGSKEHNVELRSRAKGLGWTLNEYGLHDGESRFPARLGARHLRQARPGLDSARSARGIGRGRARGGRRRSRRRSSSRICAGPCMCTPTGATASPRSRRWPGGREAGLGVPRHRRPLARRGLRARPRRLARPPAVGGDRPLERRRPDALAVQGHGMRHPGRRRARFRRRAPARLRLRRGLGPQPVQPVARGDDRALGARRLPSVRDLSRAPHGAAAAGSRTVRRRSRRSARRRRATTAPFRSSTPIRTGSISTGASCGAWLAAGGTTSIHPDAHSPRGLSDVEYGVGIARKALAVPGQVLNCRSVGELRDHFAARRERAQRLLGRGVPGA